MDWHIYTAAVASAVALHSAMEPGNVLNKLQRLANAIKTGKIDDPKMKGIDTRAKSYALGVFLIALMSLIAYFIVNAIDPSIEAALQYTIVVLLLGDLASTVGIDKYHVEIEKITQKQGKKK